MNMPYSYLVVDKPTISQYLGPDRNPWNAVEDAYYSGSLPARLAEKFADLSSGLWWRTTPDYATALELALFERGEGKPVDILAVWSPYLAANGRVGWSDLGTEFVGFDLVSIGEWSLLRVLSETQFGRELLSQKVNTGGLLTHKNTVQAIEEEYRELAASNLVEPIADAGCAMVECVSVYRTKGVKNVSNSSRQPKGNREC